MVDMNELLPLVAIASVIFGVGLSVANGYANRPEGTDFKFGKLFSSLIIGVMGSVSISMFTLQFVTDQVSELGVVAFALMFIMQGFGTDKGLSKLDG
jgi:hypothetical protein